MQERKVQQTASLLIESKEPLRTKYRQACEMLTPVMRRDKAEQLFNYVLDTHFYNEACSIMVYAGIGWEVPTHEFIKHILRDGKRVFLPYCKPDGICLGIGEIIDFYRDLIPGKYDIPEPVLRGRDSMSVGELDMVLCPGIAFDLSGNRLGKGKGYYDQFLATLPRGIPVWGVAFSCQIYGGLLPTEEHDAPMHAIVTENGFLHY
jgi:5-formyltetrahydrofolate cyclo-ligase